MIDYRTVEYHVRRANELRYAALGELLERTTRAAAERLRRLASRGAERVRTFGGPARATLPP
jgi:hypothetical protein